MDNLRERVECNGMHLVVLFMVVLTPLIAPQINVSVVKPDNSNESQGLITPQLPPSVFRNVLKIITSKPNRADVQQTKGNDGLIKHIYDYRAINDEHVHDRFRAPSFEGNNTKEDTFVEADTGATVELDCSVSSLRDLTLSWIIVAQDESFKLLTLGMMKYLMDPRYRVDRAGDEWRFTLYHARAQDTGIYSCHVSTHPPLLRRFNLRVHAPEIVMVKEAFLETDESLSLKCRVLHLYSKEVIPKLHWYKDDSKIRLDTQRAGVSIETDLLSFTSHVQVSSMKLKDAGNYTCALEAPLKMKAVARVHVLRGSSLAELQSGVNGTTCNKILLFISLGVAIVIGEAIR